MLVTVTPEQLSAAVAVPRVMLVAEHWPASVRAVRLAGAVMVGFTLSVTVTVKVRVAVPPQLLAVAVTVEVPTGKT